MELLPQLRLSRDWAAGVSGDGVPLGLALATFKYKSRRAAAMRITG